MSSRAEYRKFQKHVAARLTEARRGASQNGIAKELEYSQQMISRYESGRVPKCFLYLARLAERKNVDVNWVLAGIGEGPSAKPVPRGAVGGAREVVGDELAPELYETFEAEALIALLSLWRQSDVPLRPALTNRVRAILLWWKAQAPQLAEPLAALSRALDADADAIAAAVTDLAERFRAREDDESLRRGIRLYRFLLNELGSDAARRDVATILVRLGQMHRKTAQWAKAKEFYAGGLRVAQALDDPALLEEVWAGLGNLAEDLTDFETARTCFRHELEAAFRTGDPRLRIRSYVSLTLLAAESKANVREGIEYADAGLALCEQNDDWEYRCELLINRGVLLALAGRREEASEAYADAIRLAGGTGEARLKGTAYHNLAELALDSGDVAGAEALLDQAESWSTRAELPRLHCSILLNRARANLHENRLREAVRASRQAMAVAQRHGLGTLLDEAQSLSAVVEESVPAGIEAA